MKSYIYKDAYGYVQQLMTQKNPKLRWNLQENYLEWKVKAKEKFSDLLGIQNCISCSDEIEIKWIEENIEYREVQFSFFSEPGYRVPGHILLPKEKKEKYIPMICLQGHASGMHITLGRKKFPEDEEKITHYKCDYALQAVKRGFAAIVIEQRYMGESGAGKDGSTGCGKGKAMNALLLGRTACGERVWDIMRLIDVLEKYFEQLDMSHLICMGHSGGGISAHYAACLDERIKGVVLSCSMCTYKDSIGAMVQCSCNYVPGILRFFDMGDLAGMIAPRNLLIVSGKEDPIFPVEKARECAEIAKKTYVALGREERIIYCEGDGGHQFFDNIVWKKMQVNVL